MEFEVLGEIQDIETIASGHGIRVYSRLVRRFGKGEWRKMKGFATIRLANGRVVDAELHWYEAHGVGKRSLKIKALPLKVMKTGKRYAVCIRNEGHEESLELRKIYETLDDAIAQKDGMLRVVDEDEDYLYPASWFRRIDLPSDVEEAILEIAHS